jgi:2'-hydroxyisoflavone reductase
MSEEFLLRSAVAPWTELPLWVPETDDMKGFSAVNCDKAIAAGLTFRPLADTVRDTLAWDATRYMKTERRAGLKPQREEQLLQTWNNLS